MFMASGNKEPIVTKATPILVSKTRYLSVLPGMHMVNGNKEPVVTKATPILVNKTRYLLVLPGMHKQTVMPMQCQQ